MSGSVFRLRGIVSGSLTPSELKVFRYVVQGYTNKQIASLIRRSEDTIKFHLKKVFLKLGVTRRTHAVILGLQMGLGASDDRRALLKAA